MKKIFVIAEAGINHNGSISRAKKMIDIAKKSGADAIKFQSYFPEKLVKENSKQMSYQLVNNKSKISQYKMLKQSQLSFKNQKILFEYCNKKSIEFISTPYDEESALFLKNMGVKKIKIASTDITNLPFLNYVKKLNIHLIISTGATDFSELKTIFKKIIKKNIKNKITILQCTSNYPTSIEELNLKSILFLKKKFKVNTGFSDHSLSLISGAISVAFGANIIEKHFTLSKNLKGPDHKSSLLPSELIDYIANIRKAEKMVGILDKKVQKSEKKIKKEIQKSIFLNNDIKKNHIIRKSDLIIMRPSSSISPLFYYKLIGKRAKKNIKKYSKLNINFFN